MAAAGKARPFLKRPLVALVCVYGGMSYVLSMIAAKRDVADKAQTLQRKTNVLEALARDAGLDGNQRES